MTETTTHRTETHDPYRYGGVTPATARRFVVSLAFWTFGVLGILSGIFQLAMLLIVHTFALQNDAWNRTDNPVTLANGLFGLTVGGIAIYGARGSDRRRIVIVALAIVASILDGLYDLGLFN